MGAFNTLPTGVTQSTACTSVLASIPFASRLHLLGFAKSSD